MGDGLGYMVGEGLSPLPGVALTAGKHPCCLFSVGVVSCALSPWQGLSYQKDAP